ncbi:MAG: DUF2203 domain-containing protein [Planctomycetales bacterium]|nr:DUF2203 domain-containing protein [Planctomycetales bacterium]
MKAAREKGAKFFTVEEANRMLPLVRAIVTDLVQLSGDVSDRRHRLNHLLSGRELESRDVYSDELADAERGLRRDTLRLREYIEELRQLGVEARGDEGQVDFPATMDGRRVFLCWKLGEDEVQHWHEVDAGYAGRQPLTDRAIGVVGSRQ